MSIIYDILAAVRETDSKKEKEAILKANDSPELREYLYSVYNPQYNYYMKKIPEPVVNGRDLLPYSLVSRELLEQLRTRDLTGHAAISAIASTLGRLAPEDRELLRYTLLGDVQSGFGISTINKVWPGLIFEAPYQRCETEANARFDKWPTDKPWFVQLKADGCFVNVIKDNSSGVDFMTRQGNTFPRGCFSSLAWDVNEYLPRDTVLTGELTIIHNGTVLERTTGNGILNSVMQGEPLPEGHSVQLEAWDMIPLKDWKAGSYDVPYSKRISILDAVLCTAPAHLRTILTYTADDYRAASKYAERWMGMGYEGAVVKNPEGVWKDHTSPNQIKIKAALDIDLRMIGLTPGKGKNKNTFGSVTCISEDGLLQVDVSGFTDEQRLFIFDNWEQYANRIMTVTANQLLVPGKNNDKYSLFLPRHSEIRFDKTEADTIERIISIFKPYQPNL